MTFQRYGIAAKDRARYELAALIPFEFGGTPTTTNLWPRSKGEPATVRSERALRSLHRRFCEHQISLPDAQHDAIDRTTNDRNSDSETPTPSTTTVAPTTSVDPTPTTDSAAPTTDSPTTTTTTTTATPTTDSPTTTTSAPSTVATSPPLHEQPPATGSNGFRVVGDTIRAPDGSIFVPNGANVGTQGSFDWWGDALGHSLSAKAWGWNTIRLTLYVNDPFATGGTATRRAQQVIDEYTAKGIVVMLADWSCYSDSGATAPSLCARELAWMKDMAAANRTNPYVWINCYNEPNATDAAWVTLQNACTDATRAAGNTAPIVDDVQGAGADASWSGAAKRTYDPSMGPAVLGHDPIHNVVFSHHNYAGYCSASTEGAYLDSMHDAGLPVMIGEFGYTDDGSSSAGGYDKDHACAMANFAAAPSRGVGLLAWHATMGDHYALRADGQPYYGTSGLTDFGQHLWDVTH